MPRVFITGLGFVTSIGNDGATVARNLREMRHGFEVVIIPPVAYRGEIVSSTVIRREIAVGDGVSLLIDDAPTRALVTALPFER